MVVQVDASGCIVCPGLIDLHTHVYEYATTLGVNPDRDCLARGVTTVVDGGSSGAMTFEGLRKYICETSHTRVLAFLHVACHGLAGAGCSGIIIIYVSLQHYIILTLSVYIKYLLLWCIM